MPALAAHCGLGNIDPQHGGGGAAAAAIEACAGWLLPPDGAWLVTIRPDLDAFGGMALLALRRGGAPLGRDVLARVAAVGRADRFAHGPWPGRRPLPRGTDECAALLAGAGEIVALGGDAVAAAVADHALAVSERVEIVGRWLAGGETPAAYRDALAKRASHFAEALAGGALRVRGGDDPCEGLPRRVRSVGGQDRQRHNA